MPRLDGADLDDERNRRRMTTGDSEHNTTPAKSPSIFAPRHSAKIVTAVYDRRMKTESLTRNT
jgi:hypothetical protein